MPRTEVVNLSSPAFYYSYIDRERAAYLKKGSSKGKPLPEKPGSFQVFMRGFQGELTLRISKKERPAHRLTPQTRLTSSNYTHTLVGRLHSRLTSHHARSGTTCAPPCAACAVAQETTGSKEVTRRKTQRSPTPGGVGEERTVAPRTASGGNGRTTGSSGRRRR